MKKLIFFSCLFAILGSIWATEVSKDKYPYQWLLEGRFDGTQPIESITKGWSYFLEKNTFSKSETIEIAAYFLSQAQLQKKAIEQEKTAWGNRKYNTSALKWGSIKAIVGTWGFTGAIALLIINKLTLNGYFGINRPINCAPHLFPQTTRSIYYSFYPERYLTHDILSRTSWISTSVDAFGWMGRVMLLFLLAHGIIDISIGLDYPAYLEAKIKNLEVIIQFFQPLAHSDTQRSLIYFS